MILDHLGLISTAYAQDAAAVPPTTSGSALMQFLPLLLIFVVFYFVLIRPQQRKFAEHKTMLDALRRGDKIITGGGIIGTISKLEGDDQLVVEIAEGVKIKVLRSTVTGLLAKTEPANSNGNGKDEVSKVS